MADDRQGILGRWRVKFKKWVWEYTFFPNGNVQWLDPLNGKTGVGRWTLTDKTVYLTWSESPTKEAWNRPVVPNRQTGYAWTADGDGPVTAEKLAELRHPAAPGSDLPKVADAADQIEIAFDPATGDYVVSSPTTHPRYLDKLVTRVAYSIYLFGYLALCDDLDLPLFIPESMVDFSLAAAERASWTIFDSVEKAREAAADSPGQRRVAYFWGGGGQVVSPTIIGPATTPQLYSTILEVRRQLAKEVQEELTWLAISLVGSIGLGAAGAIFKARGSRPGRVNRGGNRPPTAEEPPAPVATRTARPKASVERLRQMATEDGWFSWGTTDGGVAQNQKVVFKGMNTPTFNGVVAEEVYVTRGIRGTGAKYGRYRVAFRVSDLPVRPTADALEFNVVGEGIPTDKSVWYTEEDLIQAVGKK